MRTWLLQGTRKMLTGRTSASTQIIDDFRSKLKMAEDLISKLTFSMREIQGVWRKPKEEITNAEPLFIPTTLPDSSLVRKSSSRSQPARLIEITRFKQKSLS